MIKRTTYKQVEPEVVWAVTLPEGAVKGRPLAAYGDDGNSKEIDSWALEDNILYVNFGIDPVNGELEYEYQVEDDSIVIEGNGGIINVTINQNNPRV